MKGFVKGVALFIGGAMVGAAAMMLLAPKATEELREQVSNMASEAKKRAQAYCEQVKQDFAESIAQAAEEETQAQEKEA